jgi:hypothetical protein
MESYDTLTDAINALKAQGYTLDFNLEKDCIVCKDGINRLSPDEFEIVKSFRFDVNEDPSDQAMLYAISSHDRKLKGLLVNGYGVYSDSITNKMLEKLR